MCWLQVAPVHTHSGANQKWWWWYSLSQLTSHPWPSFGKGENKGSVLLWYSCFDRSILMFLMHEGLQCRISILKHCLMRLWNDIQQLTFVFPFAETRSIKRMWRQLTESMCWFVLGCLHSGIYRLQRCGCWSSYWEWEDAGVYNSIAGNAYTTRRKITETWCKNIVTSMTN